MENIIFIPRFFSSLSSKGIYVIQKGLAAKWKNNLGCAAAATAPQGGTSHVTPSFLDIHLFWSLIHIFNVLPHFPLGCWL